MHHEHSYKNSHHPSNQLLLPIALPIVVYHHSSHPQNPFSTSLYLCFHMQSINLSLIFLPHSLVSTLPPTPLSFPTIPALAQVPAVAQVLPISQMNSCLSPRMASSSGSSPCRTPAHWYKPDRPSSSTIFANTLN